MIDDHTLETIGCLKADNVFIKKDLEELKKNQQLMLDFIAEQKAGRKFVWIFLGAVASLVAFVKDIGSVFTSLFPDH